MPAFFRHPDQPVYLTRDSTATAHKILANFVILTRSSLKYIQYVCVDLACKPCLRALLHHFVKKPGEISGLSAAPFAGMFSGYTTPCAIIASATLRKPAAFAPST